MKACFRLYHCSSLSSSFSSVAAMTWEDVLKHRKLFRSLSDKKKTLVTQLIGQWQASRVAPGPIEIASFVLHIVTKSYITVTF